ncbi:S8 family serine peptidase [Simiduia sp. 21SJ11W-1]|uniref:S8 family serine peptidase n=1 Tax=Simiduia sp. 21SJ11W-1 TaxID=2909669 RepID=UPI00209E3240|nr:S8 family serine peptidase [Simiduia sp. 21SJ11W-1]UTA48946.1 S8 family serine peptidase [Simiduia sp. 21SJ11W-1]
MQDNPDDRLPPLRELLLQAPNMSIAEQQRRALGQWGLRIQSRRTLASLGWVLSTYRVPDSVDLEAVKAQIANQWPVENNQRYRLQRSEQRQYAQRLLGAQLPSHCPQSPRLALLDSAVNAQLPVFEGRVQSVHVAAQDADPHPHGTGVATLMVGKDLGLLPKAQLLAVNVFAEDATGNMETRTDWLLIGLDKIAAFKPLVVNMSFGGKHSDLLAQAITQLAKQVTFVAAAGNSGAERPMYPAAYPAVQAVGATDNQLRLLALSNGGNRVFWRAPGQDVWTYNERGQGRYQTGTSFASPLVAAAIATALYEGMQTPEVNQFWPTGTPDLGDLCNAPL